MLDEVRSGDASVTAKLTPSRPCSLNKQNLIVDSISLLVDGREPLVIEMNPMGTLQRTKFCVKEGTQYRIRVDFFVQRDSIRGLKY
ncbi:hypothetical protein TELCIR_21618 [Teladorsagia circumcincta]|uniref:Uncharacterized protein n=1 Tax=Teladorsagia circumcincta TaxID=45464 RepID=A0A2G9TGA9_TELCI|nr:hypothetical protein TELCIR_21618 [Teladorsagia circumcincta]